MILVTFSEHELRPELAKRLQAAGLRAVTLLRPQPAKVRTEGLTRSL